MLVPLQMHYVAVPLREPVAWFLAMESAAEWLEEMSRWNTPLCAARLCVLPTSHSNLRPCGVLVRGVSRPTANASPRVLPYGVVGRRLYLPVNAELAPEIGDAELMALLDDETTHVWHPHAGLTSLDEVDEIRVADLLVAPPIDQTGWDRAMPGVALNSRLLSIQPEWTFSAEELLQAGRGDIGTEPIDLGKIPQAPGEPASGLLAGLGRALESGFAKAVQWLAAQAPHGGSQRNWINDLEDWATRQLQQASQTLTAAQNRELHRLMDLLKNSPDEGLKFALPMGGDSHRSVANSSSHLGPRNVDFRLSQLDGGGPASFWNVPPDYQQRLITRYRELAAREITLGRHRRAAYIFATLLGDFRSAAATLSDGGHYREAAVLYEQRLSQPLEAANCLRNGGLWSEAIVLYNKLGHHETVGDLYQQLGQEDEATAAWRKAVDARLAAEDHLGAAVLLEKKLQLPEEAFDRLLAAWPRSRQAETGLGEAFQLLGRHAWHDRAGALVAQLPSLLRVSGLSLRMGGPLVGILCKQATSYPHEELRERAADQTRVLAAECLANFSAHDSQRVLDAIARLAPQDRLLVRDCHRFTQQRRVTQSPAPKQRTAKGLVQQVGQAQLPDGNWVTAGANHESLIAAGYRGRELIAARMAWSNGEIDTPFYSSWRVEPSLVNAPVLLAIDPAGNAPAVIHLAGIAESLASYSFRPTTSLPTPLVIGPRPGLSRQTLGLVYSGHETLHVADFDGDTVTVNAFMSSTVQMLGLVSINIGEFATDSFALAGPLPLLVREATICLGLGPYLCSIARRQTRTTFDFKQPIVRMVSSAPHTRPRIAVALEQGAVMLWGATADAQQTRFAQEMPRPHLAMTRGGHLVAASQHETLVYIARDSQLHLHASFGALEAEPVAMITTRRPNEYALLLAAGQAQTFAIPE